MNETPKWQVVVTVPSTLPAAYTDSLFTAVADAAHDWEDEHRGSGWDVDVSGQPAPSADLATIERVARAIRDAYEELPNGDRPEFTEVHEWHDEARAAVRALQGEA